MHVIPLYQNIGAEVRALQSEGGETETMIMQLAS